MSALAIRSRRVLTPEGLRTAMVVVEDGIVGDLVAPRKQPRSVEVIDLGDLVLMPGCRARDCAWCHLSPGPRS